LPAADNFHSLTNSNSENSSSDRRPGQRLRGKYPVLDGPTFGGSLPLEGSPPVEGRAVEQRSPAVGVRFGSVPGRKLPNVGKIGRSAK
jgi:hypothetical protein